VTREGRAASVRGFSLVELIAAMVVMSVIAGAVGVMMPAMASGSRDGILRSQLHEEASTTVERLVREWRVIPLDAGAAPTIAPSITSASANALAWAAGSSIAVSSANLMLTETGLGANLLQADISGLTLKYYGSDGSELATPMSGAGCQPIRRISIELTLSRDGVSERIRTKVFIRSTMRGGGV
jgi:prepilin-type N-terminal cleavage/methylation domain-containing protein